MTYKLMKTHEIKDKLMKLMMKRVSRLAFFRLENRPLSKAKKRRDPYHTRFATEEQGFLRRNAREEFSV